MIHQCTGIMGIHVDDAHESAAIHACKGSLFACLFLENTGDDVENGIADSFRLNGELLKICLNHDKGRIAGTMCS